MGSFSRNCCRRTLKDRALKASSFPTLLLQSCAWKSPFRLSARARIPRGLAVFAILMLLAACGLIVDYEVHAAKDSALCQHLPDRDKKVPNLRHVWWASDVMIHEGQLTSFGDDYMAVTGNWTSLCRMDSNGDGLTNGQHLGDPCCLWQTSKTLTSTLDFSLESQHEYRRWHLTHPGHDKQLALKVMIETLKLKDSPSTCTNSYDVDTYTRQFSVFYYYKADAAPEVTTVNPLKIVCLLLMIAIIADWVIWKDSLADLLPMAAAGKGLSLHARIAVCAASFLYMDLTSGVIHLILDYAPFRLPGLGVLAKGFQFHHDDPTGIIRISWFEYVSHIHFLCPLIQVAAVLSNASRAQRLFWLSGGIWAHLFQTAHRWAHMPPANLPWHIRGLQNIGVLLSHERHMFHHQDLEHQFTILSGWTDVVLDSLSSIVPAARYDIWFLFGVFWFLVPIFADTICHSHTRLEGDLRQKPV